MSGKIKTSTRPAAKGAGFMDHYLRGRHVAVLFKLAAQAAPVISSTFDSSSAWDGRTAPANAAGSLRPAPSAEAKASGFSKPTRILTEHMTIKYPAP